MRHRLRLVVEERIGGESRSRREALVSSVHDGPNHANSPDRWQPCSIRFRQQLAEDSAAAVTEASNTRVVFAPALAESLAVAQVGRTPARRRHSDCQASRTADGGRSGSTRSPPNCFVDDGWAGAQARLAVRRIISGEHGIGDAPEATGEPCASEVPNEEGKTKSESRAPLARRSRGPVTAR